MLIKQCQMCLLNQRFTWRVFSTSGLKHTQSSEETISLKQTPEKKSEILNRKRRLIYAKGDKAFVDFKRVRFIAGKGGSGSASFVNSRDHKGGPNGGDGGHGGSIKIVADPTYSQLDHLKSQYRAKNGVNGVGRNRHGKNADDLCIPVPQGTTIYRADTDHVIADLLHKGSSKKLVRGGAGGKGNVHFKSPENVRPTETTQGVQGKEIVVDVEIKSIADVGLVGFPNAGKSTLLRAISRATPKIASYPFTTLKPNIGVVKYDDGPDIRVADIPGLIEGAYEDKGLGHTFLRHIERCQSLLYVLDISVENPLQHFHILQNELDRYKTELSRLPAMLALNKIDLVTDQARRVKEIQEKTNLPVVAISAMHKANVEELKERLKQYL